MSTSKTIYPYMLLDSRNAAMAGTKAHGEKSDGEWLGNYNTTPVLLPAEFHKGPLIGDFTRGVAISFGI